MDNLWERLRQKLDDISTGYPKTEEGYEYTFLQKIFSEKDAEFFIKFKTGPQNVNDVAEHYGLSYEEAESKLEALSDRHLLWWKRVGLEKQYRIIPYIHGLWEFNVEQIDYTDAKNMGRYYKHGYAGALMDYGIPITRVLPLGKDVVQKGQLLSIDDPETIIRNARLIVATDCACRYTIHVSPKHCECTEHLNICLTFNDAAMYCLETNCANPRVMTTEEGLEYLKTSRAEGRIFQVGNSIDISGLCSCPKCHCGFFMAAWISRGATFDNWSNYKCVKDMEACIGCGSCIEICPFKAHTLDEKTETVDYNASCCVGCGLCVDTCQHQALILERKPDHLLQLPKEENFFDHELRMGIEKHKLDKQKAAQS